MAICKTRHAMYV